ncbi:hypothetical protein QY97_02142 [Bacillus thermotolerans]|uniref:Uncharacterized protein n=1 Tax=Bacillus thermotolerans TaxID=1221996 RepID=A0A0F5HMW8_BACTR|nr:hypothetical protein QY97_02142 [Bacillus thermotolerans]KKB36334.1 hypothetical protein QY95_03198 [Bacillus thermotolerans]
MVSKTSREWRQKHKAQQEGTLTKREGFGIFSLLVSSII